MQEFRFYSQTDSPNHLSSSLDKSNIPDILAKM